MSDKFEYAIFEISQRFSDIEKLVQKNTADINRLMGMMSEVATGLDAVSEGVRLAQVTHKIVLDMKSTVPTDGTHTHGEFDWIGNELKKIMADPPPHIHREVSDAVSAMSVLVNDALMSADAAGKSVSEIRSGASLENIEKERVSMALVELDKMTKILSSHYQFLSSEVSALLTGTEMSRKTVDAESELARKGIDEAIVSLRENIDKIALELRGEFLGTITVKVDQLKTVLEEDIGSRMKYDEIENRLDPIANQINRVSRAVTAAADYAGQVEKKLDQSDERARQAGDRLDEEISRINKIRGDLEAIRADVSKIPAVKRARKTDDP